MNTYETVMIINNEISKENKENVIKKIEEYIEKNGKITEVERLGTRKLAYPVKNQLEGFYHVITFEANREAIAELERLYNE